VNIFQTFQKILTRGINSLSGKAAMLIHKPRKPTSPLADRLLADAMRLAEIPSPTDREEQRAVFVLERLKSLGLTPLVDEKGNIQVRLHAANLVNEPPLLLFADLGSNRWHPLESLSRLDADTAQGAGLADSLGAAALLSIADGVAAGRIAGGRDLLILFAARSLDDPEVNLFLPIIADPLNRPFTALGLQGLTLGTLTTRVQGLYRMEINVSPGSAKPGKGPAPTDSPAVVNSLLSVAQMLAGITWDTEGTTRLHIRRIEAAASFGKTPSEGVLEIELESSDGARLDMAMNTVKATVEKAGSTAELKVEGQITSSIPVGDSAVIAGLAKTVMGILREQKIKIQEESGTDLSAFLSNQGIPAISLGIAHGREGRKRDLIEIDSIEKGRVLLETLITTLTGPPATLSMVRLSLSDRGRVRTKPGGAS
jgi:hypothetical protein